MTRTLRTFLMIGLGALGAIAAPARGQLGISPTNSSCWAENAGMLNWHDAGPAGSQGVRVHGTYLSGYAWGENIGWVGMGTAPANGTSYANASGADAGVNRNAGTGALTGYAWGENVGWINFAGGAAATPPNPARYDAAARRFRGYAWGENIGWINLDDAHLFVGTACPADFNADGAVTVQDIFDFLSAWFAGDPRSNFNGQGGISVQDIFDYLAAWFAGC
jgi:hypothetical protein